MTDPDSLKDARRKAMDLLARREHARAELVEKLDRAGFEPGVAEDAVAGLEADGLQDDRRYVDSFIASRIRQGKGPVRIRAELGQKRLPAALVEAALADTGEDWAALASDVRRRKFGAGMPGDWTEKARQMRFLQYRGFESDHIRAALGGDDD